MHVLLLVLGCDIPKKVPDADQDGFSVTEHDCDDADPAIHPGADERCDGIDQDCDEVVDEDAVDARVSYVDADGDGWGAAAVASCEGPGEGDAEEGGDCDDADAELHPGTPEHCDERDEDCDGRVDEDAADATAWYADLDGDGFGDAGTATLACAASPGFVADATDCDDADAGVSPGAVEVCDGYDDDCDGAVDEDAGDATVWYADLDGDGFGDAATATRTCTAPAGFLVDGTDCDDGNAAVNPAAAETCDGVDSNCVDGEADAPGATAWYLDGDGDSYGDPAVSVIACEAPASYVADATDCDDTSRFVSPAGVEVCENGIDEDCSGDAVGCRAEGTSSSWSLVLSDSGGGTLGGFGMSLDAGWDADGDAADDLLAGHPNQDIAYLFTNLAGDTAMDTADASATFEAPVAGTKTGLNVAFAGDFDGDGVEGDVAVMLATDDTAGTDAGAVAVYFGPVAGAYTADVSGADAFLTGVPSTYGFGYYGYTQAMEAVGDFDGDGATELLVGAPYHELASGYQTGKAWIVGGISGTFALEAADTSFEGESHGSTAGWSVDGGDLDGDGYADAVIGSPYHTSGSGSEGAVYVVLGSTTPRGAMVLSGADIILHGANSGDRIGTFATVVPDVTGDGRVDLATGTSETTAEIYIVEGTWTGTATVDSVATLTYTGVSGYGVYGGDVDGDTEIDLYYDQYPDGSYLLYGPLTSGSATAPDFALEGLTLPIEIGNVDGDAYDDLVAGSYGSGDIRVRLGTGL